MITDDNDSRIEPGGVNSARTKAKCQCCETVFQLDPSWTYESSCPSCEEKLFCHVCYACEYHAGYGSTETAFPDMPCSECGKTTDERESKKRKRKRSMNNASQRRRNESPMGQTFVRQKPKSPFQSIRTISC